jgi:CheY-like chemotaxis protein
MAELKKLKIDCKGMSILYVEDNETLRKNAFTLLSKFFDTVYIAEDGQKGLELFQEFHPEIVLTDINMPRMSGLELSSRIRKLSSDTEIIIMSAFDDKENLHKGISIGISGFIAKPVSMTNLVEVLQHSVDNILNENNKKLFVTYIESMFNYQSSMVIMLKGTKPILANQIFLDFFGVEDVAAFIKKYGDLGEVLLEHNGFLYNKPDKKWFDEVRVNEQKLFHTKIKNLKDEFKHFMLKFQKLPDKEGYGVLSLDDITELNLLKLFDENQSKSDDYEQDASLIFNLLKVIQRNSAKVQLHNYYKGLSITHDAVIVDVKDGSIVVKTSYLQEKAVQYDKKTIMVSEAMPHPVACDEVVTIGFENQSIEFRKVHFTKASPVQRKTVRIVPDENTKVSLFLGENRYQGEVSVEDVSLDAIRLKLIYFPPGLKEGDRVIVDLVFEIDKKPVLINTQAVMVKKIENKHSFSIVLTFEFATGQKSILVKYIASRQMNIIKEFKGLQNA